MTAHHKKQAHKRIEQREGKSYIWTIITATIVGSVVLTMMGWMDWADTAPVNHNAPVSINQATQSGGLKLAETEENGGN